MPSLILTPLAPTNTRLIRLKRRPGTVVQIVADPGVLVAVQDTTSEDSPIIRLDRQYVNTGNANLYSVHPLICTIPAAFEYMTVTWKQLPATPAANQTVWWDFAKRCCDGIR